MTCAHETCDIPTVGIMMANAKKRSMSTTTHVVCEKETLNVQSSIVCVQ